MTSLQDVTLDRRDELEQPVNILPVLEGGHFAVELRVDDQVAAPELVRQALAVPLAFFHEEVHRGPAHVTRRIVNTRAGGSAALGEIQHRLLGPVFGFLDTRAKEQHQEFDQSRVLGSVERLKLPGR